MFHLYFIIDYQTKGGEKMTKEQKELLEKKMHEQKGITTEFKATEEGVFEGYAAFFNNKDSYDDVILPGAFTETIKNDFPNIKLFWNHDWSEVPIGNIVQLEEQMALGLYVKCQLNKTEQALDVAEGIKTKAITKMSIGFKCQEWEWKEENGNYVRYIKKVQLYEVSPVNFPANGMAAITSYKNAAKEELRAMIKEMLEEFKKEEKGNIPEQLIRKTMLEILAEEKQEALVNSILDKIDAIK